MRKADIDDCIDDVEHFLYNMAVKMLYIDKQSITIADNGEIQRYIANKSDEIIITLHKALQEHYNNEQKGK